MFKKFFSRFFNIKSTSMDNVKEESSLRVWKSLDDLPESFNAETELFLVRYDNHPEEVYRVQYNAETKIVSDNWGYTIKHNRIQSYTVISLNDDRWQTGKLSYSEMFKDIDTNNILVDLQDQFYHALFLNTGNRYGISLCFFNSEIRIFSTPKRWLIIPPANL